MARRVNELLGDLRQLEIQRAIAAEKVKAADAAVAAAQTALQQTSERLTALEQQRESQLPDLKVRLVDIYKRGRGGYARMLVDVNGLREFARAMRAVAALTTINEERIAQHRRTLADVRQERDAAQQRTQELQAAARDADRARLAAQRAVAAREALLTQIDQRRDLNAQLAGELDVAYQRLQEQVGNLLAGRPVEGVTIPMASFRGALDWPAPGRYVRARNGIEIMAPEGTSVTDHGSNYFSLYGYLSSIGVTSGQHVDAGTELGKVGTAPSGPPSLYFELRVDGRSVDPIQWLKPR
ncbi:MAG: hypothetical protein DMF88_20075 [Acidobacteria bacterium]|nr:MAG: hypothetical protein DMF88_20075 [Acidobacteriota bacterium]